MVEFEQQRWARTEKNATDITIALMDMLLKSGSKISMREILDDHNKTVRAVEVQSM